MHPDAYTSLAAMEQVGWYYQARARCLQRLVERFVVTDGKPLEILDVGCGTGGTSAALTRFGHVVGLEPSELALRLLQERHPELDVVPGAVADVDVLFPGEHFDLATIMGVLYHRDVADPAESLRKVRSVLRPGGWLIWNEGVYPILARTHDEFVEAGRRFRPSEMRALLVGAGFRVRFASHLLGWAFPIALALALSHRARRTLFGPQRYANHVSDDRPLPRVVNAALRELTYLEWACSLRHLKAPVGVAYLTIAQSTK
ncbi:MAG: class I SAM-dependent methyltransferase [Pirellulales bacterium]